MIKDVKFDLKDGPLTARAVFLGDMVADYGMYLKSKKTNEAITLLEGDNLNPDDDSKKIPGSLKSINGKRLKLSTSYFGNHPDKNKEYEIRLEVLQNGKVIGFNNDKSDDMSQLTDKAQVSLVLINLVSK